MATTKKSADNDEPKLGEPMAPQQGAATDPELATPVNPDESVADAAAAPEDQDAQEDKNPNASEAPGEAKGPETDETLAAEEAPNQVDPGVMDPETNPVAQATEVESKDPYAEGKHIANPEPNNGKGEDPEKWDREQEERDAKAVEESVARTEQNEADQKAAEAKADAAAEKAAK